MSIHIISCIDPTTSPASVSVDLTYLYDIRFQEHTGELITHIKDINVSKKVKFDALNLQFNRLTIDTPTFMEWVGHIVDFYWTVYKEGRDSFSPEPFHEFLRALSNFLPCNNKAVNEIANDFIKWKPQAKKFGPESFFTGYELLANAFKEARNNGCIWIKHS